MLLVKLPNEEVTRNKFYSLSPAMSFANIDLEAQKSPDGSIIDSSNTRTELDIIIEKTADQLQVFANLISQFESQRKSVGTKRDSISSREGLDKLTSRIGELDKGIKKLLANITTLLSKSSSGKFDVKVDVSNRQIVIQERLVNEYNELHRQYSKSVKEFNERKRNFPLKVDEKTPLLVSEESKSQPSHTQQQQQQQVQVQDADLINETELQYHRMLTEERNREIEQAAEGIMEVNSIFKDLGALVNQQGEQLDLVEDNIAQLHSNTQQASRELNKANEYQRKKGKWSCILLVALCIFVLVIVLAVIS